MKSLSPDAEIKPYTRAAPAPRKAETLADSVARVEKEIGRTRADIHATESAPVPSGEAKARLKIQIDELARNGQPNCLELIEQDNGAVIWPEKTLPTEFHALTPLPASEGGEPTFLRALVSPRAVDTVAMFAWLHKDALVKALEAEVDALSDDTVALADNQRATRLEKLRVDLLKVERSLEAFHVQLEAEGATVERPADADPRALLQIEGPSPQSLRASLHPPACAKGPGGSPKVISRPDPPNERNKDMTNWNEKWAATIEAANAKQPPEAVEPEHTAVTYNDAPKAPTHEAYAADAPAAEREQAIRNACALAGYPYMASVYVSKGYGVREALADLQRTQKLAQAH